VKAGRVFILSVLLNLALAGWIARQLGRPSGNPVTAHPAPAPAVPRHRGPTASVAEPGVSPALASWTNRFHWRAIETNDFVQFATNLRAVDCPEKTVIEIVSARARRALRRCAVAAEPSLPFWATGTLRESTRQEAIRQVAAARTQILARVDQALGSGNFIADTQLTENFVDQALGRFCTGPMSEESFYRLQRAFERQTERMTTLRMLADNVLLEADELAMAQSSQQLRQEIATALSPAEFEEYGARMGIFKMSGGEVRFDATELSAAEVRQIGLIRGRVAFENQEKWMDDSALSEAQETQVSEDWRKYLGNERLAQIERATDNNFKALFDIGRDRQLPKDAALQAFELRQSTAQNVAAVRADPSLSAEERQQRLAAMQAEAAAAIWKVLGAEAAQEYLGRAGAWMTNVNQL